MKPDQPPFTIGLEEEYLLVDRKTRDLAIEVPDALRVECQRRLKSQVSPEFLQSQIEVGTGVCDNIKQAARELASRGGRALVTIGIKERDPFAGLAGVRCLVRLIELPAAPAD